MDGLMLQKVADEEMQRNKWKYFHQLDRWIEHKGLLPNPELPICQPSEQKPSCTLQWDAFIKLEDHDKSSRNSLNSACAEFIAINACWSKHNAFSIVRRVIVNATRLCVSNETADGTDGQRTDDDDETDDGTDGRTDNDDGDVGTDTTKTANRKPHTAHRRSKT